MNTFSCISVSYIFPRFFSLPLSSHSVASSLPLFLSAIPCIIAVLSLFFQRLSGEVKISLDSLSDQCRRQQWHTLETAKGIYNMYYFPVSYQFYFYPSYYYYYLLLLFFAVITITTINITPITPIASIPMTVIIAITITIPITIIDIFYTNRQKR